MTRRLPLKDFLVDAPRLSQPLIPVTADPQLHASVEMPQDYVWPDLEVVDESDAPVVLLSAPGAMGKSYTSRAVASYLGVPLLDLSGLRVGSNTLLGRIFRWLGPTAAQDYLTAVSEGRGGLLLDGTDEAQLLAGRNHYIEFLQDVAELVRGGRARRQIVLLGRPDAMLMTEAALFDYGVPFMRVQLAPFSKQQANTLLDNTLDRVTENGRSYDIHRTHRVPFDNLRDAVLQDLSDGLGNNAPLNQADSWASVQNFLGYPPVLLALAARLRVDNPLDELNRLQLDEKMDRREERGSLLREIMENILDRESAKVRGRICPTLSIPEEDPRVKVLYTRAEQLLRVMNVAAGSNGSIVSPAVLTAEQKAVYDEQVGSFVLDHPFLIDRRIANVVFADYVRAFLNYADDSDLHGLDREQILASCPPVGPFFAHFMHSLSSGVLEDEALVDSLMRSFAAGEREQYLAYFEQENDTAALSLMSGAVDSRLPATILHFNIIAPSGVLVLSSPVQRAVIITPNAVVLDAIQAVIEIGPNVTLIASELEIGGKQLYAIAQDFGAAHGVVLAAHSEIVHDSALKVIASQPNYLSVQFPKPGYQWRPYAFDLPQFPNEQSLTQLVIAARRILSGFRGSATEPSLYYEMLENLVVGRNRAARIALNAFIELEVVERRGDLYFINTAKLQPYGFGYVDLQSADFAAKLTPLVNKMSELAEVADFLDLR